MYLYITVSFFHQSFFFNVFTESHNSAFAQQHAPPS